MKRFFALILAGLMVASVTTSAFAQNAGPRGGAGQQRQGGGQGGGQRGGMRIDMTAIHARVVASLGLTAAQKTAVNAADKKNKAAMDKIEATYKGKTSDADRQKRRDASMKQRTAHQAELKKAMGAKFATYQTKMQAEVQKEMAKRGAMTMGRGMQVRDAAHAKVIAGLGLTAAQKTSVAAADKKYKDGMAALQKKYQSQDFSKMTDAQRKAIGDGFAKLNSDRDAALKKAMGAKYATYKTKLDAEMKKEMEKMRGGTGRPGGGAPPKSGGRGA